MFFVPLGITQASVWIQPLNDWDDRTPEKRRWQPLGGPQRKPTISDYTDFTKFLYRLKEYWLFHCHSHSRFHILKYAVLCIIHSKHCISVCTTQIRELVLGWIIALILDSGGNSQDLKRFTNGDVMRLMITVDFLWAEHRKHCLVRTVHSIVFLLTMTVFHHRIAQLWTPGTERLTSVSLSSLEASDVTVQLRGQMF